MIYIVASVEEPATVMFYRSVYYHIKLPFTHPSLVFCSLLVVSWTSPYNYHQRLHLEHSQPRCLWLKHVLQQVIIAKLKKMKSAIWRSWRSGETSPAAWKDYDRNRHSWRQSHAALHNKIAWQSVGAGNSGMIAEKVWIVVYFLWEVGN